MSRQTRLRCYQDKFVTSLPPGQSPYHQHEDLGEGGRPVGTLCNSRRLNSKYEVSDGVMTQLGQSLRLVEVTSSCSIKEDRLRPLTIVFIGQYLIVRVREGLRVFNSSQSAS